MCSKSINVVEYSIKDFPPKILYHFRRWLLEGNPIASYFALRDEGLGQSMKIILPPA